MESRADETTSPPILNQVQNYITGGSFSRLRIWIILSPPLTGEIHLLMEYGNDNCLKHENFQIFKIDGKWRLLTTDYSPHHPYLYTMRGYGSRLEDWVHWEKGYMPISVNLTVDFGII